MEGHKNFITRQEEAKALIARASKAAADLPQNYLAIIIHHYPEYNTIRGGRLIDNVRRGKSSHQHLTEILEKIQRRELSMPVLMDEDTPE